MPSGKDRSNITQDSLDQSRAAIRACGKDCLDIVPTFSLVFFHCQHSIVWEDLKPLKLKEESNPVLSSLGQKLLHSRDENIFGLYYLHKPCVRIFRPNSRDTPGQRYQFSEILSKMPKD